jgi:hypothetical protein
MTRLLERLAMDKVAEGDDAGARQVLQVSGVSMRVWIMLAGKHLIGTTAS